MSHILQIPETSKLRDEYGDQVDLSSLTASQLLTLKSQLDGEYSISLVRRPTPSREQLNRYAEPSINDSRVYCHSSD